MSAKPAHEAASSEGLDDLRMRLLQPMLSERAMELARGRVLNPERRLVERRRKIPSGDSKEVVKIALILVLLINPGEALTNEEDGLRRGLNAETVGSRKRAKEI